MKEVEVKLAISALLSFVGKLYYRGSLIASENFGYTALKSKADIKDESILDALLHHKLNEKDLESIKDDSLAYIVNMAEHIADAADFRKEKDYISSSKNNALSSIFNKLKRVKDLLCKLQ